MLWPVSEVMLLSIDALDTRRPEVVQRAKQVKKKYEFTVVEKIATLTLSRSSTLDATYLSALYKTSFFPTKLMYLRKHESKPPLSSSTEVISGEQISSV